MSRMNWLHLVMIALILAVMPGASPVAAHDRSTGPASAPNELIMRLAVSADPQRFAATAGLVLRLDGRHKIPGEPIYRFTIVDGTTPQRKAASLAGRSGVIYAEPNYLGQLPEAQKRSSWVVGLGEGDYTAQWAAERIRLGEAHRLTSGAGVTVAVLDTGVELAHPALAMHLVPGYDFIDDDDTPEEELPTLAGEADDSDSAYRPDDDADDDDTDDDGAYAYGHGTHVAGLVALAAPGAAIMPLRTLKADGTGDLWTQILALRYAASRGADVINLSFSFGTYSALFDDVVAEVTCTTRGFADCRAGRRPGAVVVAAAGNAGTSARQWPAASTLPGVIAVAASTEQDTLAGFSSYGSWVRLAAPGDRILSSIPTDTYAAWSGTSMAAPLTAGVSALVRAARPGLAPAEVIRQLIGSAATIEAPVKRRLDAAAAVAP